MTVRPIRILGDPVLRTPCAPVTDIDASIRALVEDLLDTVDDPGRAGVSANQIGVSLRVFSWNVDGQLDYIINPVITYRSKELQDGEEGCLSVPDLWYPLARSEVARAEGIDLDGHPKIVEGDDVLGRCIQHEVDHLDGHVYLDRLDRAWRKEAFRDIRERL
ncbi:peptide deformylase [Neoactinobaculum massilliense]|uniref:peptide deformylase n=1 Tax=Neoactinobaculum massilliense TaxID=2364794 RepID=UPI000F5403B4|nr:peptide deformylase [Neoactinobaculum massilliense]